MNDLELIERFMSGDRQAFHLLMSKYQQHVFYTVKAVLIDKEDAKDVTQKTFITVFQKLERLRDRERFKSWLMRIAMNCANDHLRKKPRECEFTESMLDRTHQSVEGEVVAKDAIIKVRAALSLLPEKQRMVLGLRLFRELNFGEIAEIVNIKPATARSNFHFGMKKLMQHLKEYGIDNEN